MHLLKILLQILIKTKKCRYIIGLMDAGVKLNPCNFILSPPPPPWSWIPTLSFTPPPYPLSLASLFLLLPCCMFDWRLNCVMFRETLRKAEDGLLLYKILFILSCSYPKRIFKVNSCSVSLSVVPSLKIVYLWFLHIVWWWNVYDADTSSIVYVCHWLIKPCCQVWFLHASL